MADEERNIQWLTKKVGDLFTDAAGRDEPDHSACVRYAEILAKVLLPQAGGKQAGRSDMDLEKLRQEAAAERRRLQEETEKP